MAPDAGNPSLVAAARRPDRRRPDKHFPGEAGTAPGEAGRFPGEPARTLSELDVSADFLRDLVLRLATTVTSFTTEWMARQVGLSLLVVTELLDQLRQLKLVEILGQQGPLNDRFAATQLGIERSTQSQRVCGYLGPAPVALDSYIAGLRRQLERLPPVEPDQVAFALRELVLPELAGEVAGLAMSSRRSLLVFGPPGNGKTSLGRLLHGVVDGRLWIPHAVVVGQHVIRFYDPQCHERLEEQAGSTAGQAPARRTDARWIPIRRPFVMVGGELTLGDLELGYNSALGCHEAPIHLKANGGTFLLDDLGCQRDDPEALLKRWFVPLDQKNDFLTLESGQKVRFPFELMLIISTNLAVNEVMTPAILRRMGYRLHVENPDAERYGRIFERYAAERGVELPADLIPELLARYAAERRPLRGCEPNDLLGRVADICRFRNMPLVLNADLLDLAWKAYFSES
ncbi:MAG: hypothetical protein J5I93_30060 [Pirellulaceae bacterium]|nr:hypothetical protein [Pirellulaceae bacterium]